MKSHYIMLATLLLVAICCGIFCNKIADQVRSTAASAAKVNSVVRALSSGSSNPSYVMIGINQAVDYGVDSTIQVQANAAITDSATGQLVKLTSVAINSQVMYSSPDSIIRFTYTDSSGSLPAQGKALAGTTMSVKITGSTAADTLSERLYMPKNVMNLTSDFPHGGYYGVSNASPLTLRWVADPGNGSGMVQIQIRYYGALSQLRDSTLPATDTSLVYNVTDNGSYTIPWTAMALYPTGCYVGISIGRGSQVQGRLPVSGRLINFWAGSLVMSIPLLVNDL